MHTLSKERRGKYSTPVLQNVIEGRTKKRRGRVWVLLGNCLLKGALHSIYLVMSDEIRARNFRRDQCASAANHSHEKAWRRCQGQKNSLSPPHFFGTLV